MHQNSQSKWKSTQLSTTYGTTVLKSCKRCQIHVVSLNGYGKLSKYLLSQHSCFSTTVYSKATCSFTELKLFCPGQLHVNIIIMKYIFHFPNWNYTSRSSLKVKINLLREKNQLKTIKSCIRQINCCNTWV